MNNDKRNLTEKELKRKDDFEKFNYKIQLRNATKRYKTKNLMINTQQAKPLWLLIMLPFMAFVFQIYHNLNDFDSDCLSSGFPVVLPVLILCLSILHKLIHGITRSLSVKNHSIDFGIIRSSFSLYCTYSNPLKKWQYLLVCRIETKRKLNNRRTYTTAHQNRKSGIGFLFFCARFGHF